MMRVIYVSTGGFPYGMEFRATCKHNQTFSFHLSHADLTLYRGSADELKQVTAHQVALQKCDACRAEQAPALPATRFPEGAEL
jgi:hypothetical protein